MKVEFYGHVRQYKNIQKEIDANIQEVLWSGNYVQGPMLKRFEGEFAKYLEDVYSVLDDRAEYASAERFPNRPPKFI